MSDIVVLKYDRPTDGDITLFSDFSKLVDQVQENTDNISKASRKLIEQSKIGTDPDFWGEKIKDQEDVIAHAKHEKAMAGVNFGLSLFSSITGVDIKGVTAGASGTPPRLESKYSTRMEVYKKFPEGKKSLASKIISQSLLDLMILNVRLRTPMSLHL